VVPVSRAQRRNEWRLLAGYEQALTSVARPWPTTVLWRWRYELLLALGCGYLVWVGGSALLWVAMVGAVAAAALIAVPPVRRFATAHAWCVLTAHRVRSGCAQGRIHSRQGRLPAILFTGRQEFGERVWLWCPAGTSAEDFEAARSMLAAACWATDVRVGRDPRHAHLVTLDVIRRDLAGVSRPLAARARRHAAAADPAA
jgi:hypothetical protein